MPGVARPRPSVQVWMCAWRQGQNRRGGGAGGHEWAAANPLKAEHFTNNRANVDASMSPSTAPPQPPQEESAHVSSVAAQASGSVWPRSSPRSCFGRVFLTQTQLPSGFEHTRG